jgi:uncharacterized membrane protein YozB (DUF420 family)
VIESLVTLAAGHPLVHVNASLNTLAAVLLVCGYVVVKRGNIEAHKRFMLAAFATSTLFLACYLYYHAVLKLQTPFPGSGPLKWFYLTLLATHVLLAATVPFLAIAAILQGFRSQGEWLPRHVRTAEPETRATYIELCRRRHIGLAKWTFPIWMYVSVTGVLVYAMLYHVAPAIAG